MSRSTLHNLVEIINEKDLETVYQILLRFVEEDTTTYDEAMAIQEAKQDILKGSLYTHNEVWGNS